MAEEARRREVDMHRRVCVITPENIDIRPARSAAIVPLIGFGLGVLAFISVLLWLDSIPFTVVLLLMGAAILLVPFSGMGFVYSIYGANVVFNRAKRTALWQQGLFGMGVGTSELVPFDKVDRIEVEEISADDHAGGAQDFAQFEVTLLKVSGKRLSIGQITVPQPAGDEGFERAVSVARAVAEMTGKPMHVVDGEDLPQEPPGQPSEATTA